MCVELGINPFIFFLIAIIHALYFGVTKKRFAEIGSLIALLIFASMSYPFSILPFSIVLVFLLASISSVRVNSPEKSENYSFYRIATPVILSISIGIIFLCMDNRYPTYQAYKDWNQVKTLYNMELYKEAIKDYNRLEPYLNDQANFMFEYGKMLSYTGEYKKSNDILLQATKMSCDPMFYNIIGKNYQALEKYDLAEQYFRKAAYIVPNKVYPYYLLAQMYVESGQTKKAKQMANIVLVKEPKTQSMAINEMREEMKKILNIL